MLGNILMKLIIAQQHKHSAYALVSCGSAIGEAFLFLIQTSWQQPNELKPSFLSADWRREFGCFSTVNQGARRNCVGRHSQLTPIGREGCDQRLTDSSFRAAKEAEAMEIHCSCTARIPTWIRQSERHGGPQTAAPPETGTRREVMSSRCDTHTMELMTYQGQKNLSLCNQLCCKKL